MEISQDIQKLIEEISFRKPNSKDYEKMKIEEISKELRDIMRFEQESFRKIESFAKTKSNTNLIEYAKMLCRNTIQREIVQIQKIYLKKIEDEYINSK